MFQELALPLGFANPNKNNALFKGIIFSYLPFDHLLDDNFMQ